MRLLLIVISGAVVGVIVARLAAEPSPSGGESTATKTLPSPRANMPPVPEVSHPVRPVRQRDLAPSDRRYDPVALLREMKGELEVQDIFAQEPRDATFAPTMEQRIDRIVGVALHELDLEKRVRSVTTECRTLSCYTKLEVAKSDARYVYDLVNGIMLGDVHVPGIDDSAPDVAYVTVSSLNRPESRDDSYHQRFLTEAMRPALDLAKQRRREEARETDR